MPSNPRIAHLLSGVAGGLVVIVVGAVLLATDVIETGDTTEVVQQPVTQPAAGGDSDGDGLTVSDIYERVGPGVVFVQAEVARETDSPFGFPQPRRGVATGSGFVLDREGYILTNAHVVQGANRVGVEFGDGDTIEAKLEGADPSTDLAVLRVDPDDARLRPLRLGDSGKVEVGDPTIAIGNPFGFDRTVTTGIVSALQRQIEAPNGFTINDVIQTDASINPGNSGGPLLDGAGRVIGINSQIATGGGRGSVGIGFAVPINTAKTVVPQLKERGRVRRAYLGVTTTAVTKRIAEDLNLPVDEGALIQETVANGPADKAGLRGGRTPIGEDLRAGGDVIVKVDGKEISKPEDVGGAIADNKPGDEVTVEYYRGDDRESTKVKLGERPRSLERPGGSAPEDAPEELFPFP